MISLRSGEASSLEEIERAVPEELIQAVTDRFEDFGEEQFEEFIASARGLTEPQLYTFCTIIAVLDHKGCAIWI